MIFGSGWHTHVQIAELTDDYLKPSGVFTNHFQRPGPPTGREAPAIFKHRGRYYLITSGTTGWACNDALYAVADATGSTDGICRCLSSTAQVDLRTRNSRRRAAAPPLPPRRCRP